MLRSTANKVMWVGRATVFLVGLAVILALVVGLASTALAANGANFIIGNGLSDTVKNIATLPTKLTMQGTSGGPALQVTQQSTNSGASGVGVTVPAGKAPLTVNSGTKVANLNADKIDGKDSTALGVTMKTSMAQTSVCASPQIWTECAPVTVTVPAGKQYHVTVWSSVSASTLNNPAIGLYCPAINGGSFGLSCITPNVAQGRPDQLDYSAIEVTSASSSGDIGSLSAGTYTFSTAFKAGSAELYPSPTANVHTTVMVRDVSAPGPSIN